MKTKNYVIVFNENGLGARILINPPDLELFANNPNALINADIRLVRQLRTPPQLWKKEGNKVIPCSKEEIGFILDAIKKEKVIPFKKEEPIINTPEKEEDPLLQEILKLNTRLGELKYNKFAIGLAVVNTIAIFLIFAYLIAIRF